MAVCSSAAGRLAGLAGLVLVVSACGGGGGSSKSETIYYEGYRSAVYEDDAHWLCRPDLDDGCLDRLDSTAVAADGTLTVEPFQRAEKPAFDCFWVYPTVRLGNEGNAPFDGDYRQELFATRNQVSRLGEHCALYAPVYRQRTLGSPTGTGIDYREIAYADVLDAFRTYLSQYNHGRPFMVMGHSQGAGHLRRLIAEEIDPVQGLRERMISAVLLGTTVEVPRGQDVGGSFQNIPACRQPDQIGCVVSYSSFRATVPPPPTSRFARAQPGMQALCTNPADLRGPGGYLTPYFDIVDDSIFSTANPRLPWGPTVVNPPRILTPFVSLPGLVHSVCEANDDFSWLVLSINADPVDPRADDIGGDLTPDWGMHLVDANVAMGNLVDIVAHQANVWRDVFDR